MLGVKSPNIWVQRLMSKSQCPSTPTLVTLLSACNRFMRMAAGPCFYTSLHIRPKHTSRRLGTQPTSRRNTPVLHRFSNLDVGSTTIFCFKWTFLTKISHWLRNQQCGSMIMDPGTVPTNFHSIKWTPSRTSYRSWEALKDERTWPAAKWWTGIAVYLICFLLRKSTSTPTAANTQRLQTPDPIGIPVHAKGDFSTTKPIKSSLHVLTMITKLREWSCHGRLVFILKKCAYTSYTSYTMSGGGMFFPNILQTACHRSHRELYVLRFRWTEAFPVCTVCFTVIKIRKVARTEPLFLGS